MACKPEAVRGLRQAKAKFTSGEKILCFEPDPNKVKILYEAKILEVQTALGPLGKKRNEFLVHFQGWNSSWDRYVLEDMILKDNTENRALQDQLEKESVEQEKLAKKLLKKKKMDRRLSDRSTSRLSTDNESVASTGDGEGGMMDDPEDTEIKFKKEADTESVSDAETDTQTEPSNSPGIKLEDGLHIKEEGGEEDPEEEEEEICHEVAPLVISEGLKRKLEHDHILVTKKKRLVHLPAQPNIVDLLEMFVRDFAIQRLAQLEKQVSRNQYGVRLPAEKEAEKYEEAVVAIDLCKEVAEGLRIIVDFQLGKLLLYPMERHQFSQSRNMKPVLGEGRGKSKSNKRQSVGHEEEAVGKEVQGGSLGTPVTATSGRKRKTTGRSLGEEGGVPASIGSTSSGTGTPTLGTPYPSSSKSHAVLAAHLHSWKLVPESFHFQEPVPSSLVYGGIHLARLLVKLPSILGKMKFTMMSAKNVHKYLELIESFVASQTDIFVEDSYK